MYVPDLEIPPTSRHQTLAGLATSFYHAQKDVTLAGIDDKKLPFFVRRTLKRFFEVGKSEVKTAILDGDPWFFLGWRARLAQVDAAMISAGLSVADRWSLVRAQHMLTLLQEIAARRLVALGGTDEAAAPNHTNG